VTERGLPIVDGAPACPFVAFADDRDERATSPDHRHRCYAELRPSPRALAHQEAYCLASAFPVCPTFQDWARREAARARSGATSPGQPTPGATPRRDSGDTPPGARAAGAAGAVVGAGAGAGAAAGAGAGGPFDTGGDIAAPNFLADRDRTGGGLAGSTADRVAGSTAAGEPDDRGSDEPAASDGDPATGAAAAAPAAGSAPALPAFLGPPPSDGATRGGRSAGDVLDDEVDRQDASWSDSRRDAPDDRRPGTGIFGDRRPKVGDTRPRREPTNGPGWEPSRRQAAYPTRRTRVGLPALTGVGIAAVLLGIAAIALFALPGLLRNNGSASPGSTQGPGASPSIVAGGSPSASPAPSPTPAASLYIVQPGDTLSEIAARFGIPLAQLIEANAERLPDPNNLQIGDELIIPAVSGASPGASPTGSVPLP